jgi:hypothetical protein
MRMRKLLFVPLMLVTLLSGCAAPAADQGSNSMQNLIDLIPWAKSVADSATAEEVTTRIDEVIAALPMLAVSQATKDELTARLKTLKSEVVAHPDNRSANAAELRAIIELVRAAVEHAPSP